MARAAGRSFAALVAVGATVELGGAAMAALGLRTLARCYVGWPAGSRASRPAVCMEPIAGVGFHLFVPAAVIIAVLCTSVVLGGVQVLRSLRDVKRLNSLLGPTVTALPDELRTAAQRAGVSAVELRDHEEPYGICIGIFGPRVAISTALLGSLTPDEIVAVLAHEERHRRRRAPLRRLVARAMARAFFYVPALRDLSAIHVVEEEIVADEESCAVAGTRPLVQALAKLSGLASQGGAALAFGDASSLPYRLQAIREGRIVRPALRGLSTVVSASSLCVLLLLLLWMPLSGAH